MEMIFKNKEGKKKNLNESKVFKLDSKWYNIIMNRLWWIIKLYCNIYSNY